MKYLLIIFTILSALATVCVLIMFVFVFIAWLNGGGSVLLPGLGLIISAPPILVVFFIIGAILLSLTILLVRQIFKRIP